METSGWQSVVRCTLVLAAAAYNTSTKSYLFRLTSDCKMINVPTWNSLIWKGKKKKKSPFEITVGVMMMTPSWSLVQCGRTTADISTILLVVEWIKYRGKSFDIVVWYTVSGWTPKETTRQMLSPFCVTFSCHKEGWTGSQNSMKNIFMIWRFISFSGSNSSTTVE